MIDQYVVDKETGDVRKVEKKTGRTQRQPTEQDPRLQHWPESRITVAWYVKAGKTYLGVAMCAPDDQFRRDRGRDIALGRLAVKPAILLDNVDVEDFAQDATRQREQVRKEVMWANWPRKQRRK